MTCFKDNQNIEIKSINEEKGIVTFYGSVFGNKDSYNDIVVKGAFEKTIKENKNNIRFLYSHNSENIIGKFISLKEDDYGLLCEAQLFMETESGKEKFVWLKNKQISGFSIGYIPVNYEIKKEKEEEIRYLKEVKLFEISLVNFPANKKAQIINLKSDLDGEYKITDDKFNEEEERQKITHCLGITNFDNLEIGGKLVFSYKNNELFLNYNAVNNLDNEIKANNPLIIANLYNKFRQEFKDKTLFSNVCNKIDVISTWNIEDYTMLLKHNNFTTAEIKAFYKRLADIRRTPEEIKNNITVKEKIEKNNLKNNPNAIEGIDY